MWLQVEVPEEYHSQIIGKKGKVITEIRDEFNVNITMPKKENGNPCLITIKGMLNFLLINLTAL